MEKQKKRWLPAVVLAAGIAVLAAPEAIKAAETTEPVSSGDVNAAPVPSEASSVTSAEMGEVVVSEAPERTQTDTNTTDFSNIGVADFSTGENTVTVGNNSDNHFAMYNGLTEPTNDFSLEADVAFQETNNNGNNCAALVFGTTSKTHPQTRWYAVNVDMSRADNPDLFRIFGPGFDTTEGGEKRDIDLTQPLHMKVDVMADGTVSYIFGNVNGPLYSINTVISNWQGGYVGLLSFRSDAVFSNITFIDRMDHALSNTTGADLPLGPEYNTNLTDASYLGGTWTITPQGLSSNAVGQGDTFVFTKVMGNDFVYSTDIDYSSSQGAAGLIFRFNNRILSKEAYAVNLDVGSHKVKFWRWHESEALQLIDEKDITPTDGDRYTIKVVSIDSWIQYYVNDVLVASLGDYTLQRDDKGQPTYIDEGYFGLLNWNSDVTFQNTYYQTINDAFTPVIHNVSVRSSTGTVEKPFSFNPLEPIRIQYVKNNATTVDLDVTPANGNAVIQAFDADGNEISLKDIPVQEGANYITLVSSIISETGQRVSATYRINVHRLQADEIYGQEPYRGQYHYSVREGWANDPNGMVYYKGTYHLFYQFYDDITWGPMHWAHATSTDLIHWTEQPIALYPDANGTMFSGCIVVDEKNTSGLFKNGEGGLVALITADGNGQRIKVAYSEDEGMTWTKVDTVVADWLNDPLASPDFRDPKVFRWDNQWFMVIAGGPLRIYSSDNLLSWKLESAYPNIHTECPDLYPIQTDSGIKWVLDRGGRTYKVGDFKPVNGKWTYVPDAAYADPNDNGIMNFGKDSYAAMTYYIQDFGTEANPTLPDIIAINWMNTWDDYCRIVAEKVNQKFNGTFNLNLKMGLKQDDAGNWVLTQTPVDAYESIRDDLIVKVKNALIVPDLDNGILDAVQSDTYEIIATFRPVTPSGGATSQSQQVGFRLRTNGSGQETLVYYDLINGTLNIDRSRSGVILSDIFKEVNSQIVTRNADGSITMRIFVDRASVEVFNGDYTVAGANQIFPDADALGASVYAIGTSVRADIQVYTLKVKDVEPEEPNKPDHPTKPYPHCHWKKWCKHHWKHPKQNTWKKWCKFQWMHSKQNMWKPYQNNWKPQQMKWQRQQKKWKLQRAKGFRQPHRQRAHAHR